MKTYKIKLLEWKDEAEKRSVIAFSITRISYTIYPLIGGSTVLSASQQTGGCWTDVLSSRQYNTVDESKAAAQAYHIKQMEKGLEATP